jgi:hypothetical protein
MYISLLKFIVFKDCLPDGVVERWGLLMQSITLEVVFSSLTSLLFHEGYTSFEE